MLEVDGPSHFTHNTHRPLGSTRLRRQLLKAQGMIVISIPWFEWVTLNRVVEKEVAYLRQRLLQVRYLYI